MGGIYMGGGTYGSAYECGELTGFDFEIEVGEDVDFARFVGEVDVAELDAYAGASVFHANPRFSFVLWRCSHTDDAVGCTGGLRHVGRDREPHAGCYCAEDDAHVDHEELEDIVLSSSHQGATVPKG
jgi:hypothetical protein